MLLLYSYYRTLHIDTSYTFFPIRSKNNNVIEKNIYVKIYFDLIQHYDICSCHRIVLQYIYCFIVVNSFGQYII